MANKRPNPPPIHSRFKPGQSGNPSGKPKGLLSTDEIASLMAKFCRLTRDELQGIVQDPKSSMIEITVASILAKAAKDGDYSRLEFLLTRSIGKVKDVVAHEHVDVVERLKDVPKETLISFLKERVRA